MRTTEDIIEFLKGDPPPPDTAPELVSTTPSPDGNSPHSLKARSERRAAMIAATPPVSTARTPEDRLEAATRYPVIARMLAFNATNAEILEALAAVGHEISERTLQRTLKREDFIRYYEAFQGDINARITKLLEETAVLAAPEAINHLIRLMRSARSSETERQAANDLLRYAGFGRSDGPSTLHVHLPPEMASMIAREGKRIASEPLRALQTGPIIDVEATEVVESG